MTENYLIATYSQLSYEVLMSRIECPKCERNNNDLCNNTCNTLRCPYCYMEFYISYNSEYDKKDYNEKANNNIKKYKIIVGHNPECGVSDDE